MISVQDWEDTQLLWDYLQMHHEPRPCSVGIGLGSHDLGVADTTVDLYRRGMMPLIVFTGATSRTTQDRMPRGEAEHYRDRALELGVPAPYEERRAYATARKLWPEVEFVSASTPMTLPEYVDSIRDARLVIDMLVGSLQRLLIYPVQGFMISQDVPDEVIRAYERLASQGFTSRLVPENAGSNK
ncbi:YdcF family protein [Streptomyces sp. NPDC004227]